MNFSKSAISTALIITSGMISATWAAEYPPNIDYGSQGEFVAKRGVTHGRTANLTALGPVLINVPEAPGSSAAGGVTYQPWNTAWDLSDLTNPTLISRISENLTQPVEAHGTAFRFDGDDAYVYTRGSEVNGVDGRYLRFEESGATSLDQLVPNNDYLFNESYQGAGIGSEILGYSMMTSPYTARTYWEYGFDPSGLYQIRDPSVFDESIEAPWLGVLIAEWDHLGTTSVTGFSTFLGELLVVASDQQSTGIAVYDTAGLKSGDIPVLLSQYKPTLTEPDGNQIGIGGYWMEPYGANKIVWAAREHGTSPLRNYPAMYVVDFTDPRNPMLTCELYFNQSDADSSDGDGSSDPMYVNFQDNYAFVDHFKVDISACEAAYADQTISDAEFDQIVFKFDDLANSCDSSQYFRPLGQMGVFGGYDFWVTNRVIAYSGSGVLNEDHSYARQSDHQAWVDSGFSESLWPAQLTVNHHIEPGLAVGRADAFVAGDVIIDMNDYWEDIITTYTLTDVISDERVNEQGMCFFVTSDEADTTPPYISGHRPLANQINYPVDRFISLHIPETLRVETVSNAVTVTNLESNQAITFKQQLSHTGTLSIWPNDDFDLNVSYRVDVAGIQDFMGNTMVPYSFTFTTGEHIVDPSPEPDPEPAPQPPFVGTPYYPNQSGQIACEIGDDADTIWVVNPDNDTVSIIEATTDPDTFEVTTEINTDGFVYSDGKPTSITRVNDLLAITYSNLDKIRYYRLGWWGTSPYTAWSSYFKYGSNPIASVAHGDMLYVALYNSGEIAKIDTSTKQIISIFPVGPKPKAMALSSDGSRLLVTRFISTADYAEVYDINTAGTMSFRDPAQPSIHINKVLVPDDLDHGSGVPNYLRSIVIGPNNDVAYVTANKANIDRGLFLTGQALDDDNTIRPMIATLDLINHRDINTDPSAREGTIDLDNGADPSGITILPDGVTRVHALQGNNVVEFSNLALNTTMRASTGFAPQDMCTTQRNLYVKNRTDRTVSVIDIANFMYDGRQNPVIQTVATVSPENEIKTPEALKGLQLFYHARTPDISPEGYISCASCHDDGGHDGMTWDLTHMGEGLRNTLSLRGTSGTRFGNLHWSSNFDEIQDFEIQLERLNGADGLIPGTTFTESNSPLTHVTAGSSEELDALAAYISGLGKESVLRSPNSCSWGGRCSSAAHSGAWQFHAYGCADCHTGSPFRRTGSAFRDGLNHDMGTIKASSGQGSGGVLTAIRTPTLIELWDTAPYLHDGSAATLQDVMNTGVHASYGLDARETNNLIQYLLNLDRLDFIDDDEPF
jgi:hypothetical protein